MATILTAVQLLKLFSRSPAPPAAFVEGRVGYAVGDIHGRADLLAKMLDQLEARVEVDTRPAGPPLVIFLGDYVDRGPDSVGVIELLLSGRPHGFERRYLRGNHEQAMMGFLAKPVANRQWLLQGGLETMLSYGIQPPAAVGAEDKDWIAAADALKAKLPESHLAFLNALERYVVLGDYAFVHAGVDAARSLEDQTDDDLYWSRERFIASKRRFSHKVVHGHTPVDKPFADDRRIAVDTGAYASGTLTAARLEGEHVSFLPVSDHRPRVR